MLRTYMINMGGSLGPCGIYCRVLYSLPGLSPLMTLSSIGPDVTNVLKKDDKSFTASYIQYLYCTYSLVDGSFSTNLVLHRT